jgi:hypothetical protein
LRIRPPIFIPDPPQPSFSLVEFYHIRLYEFAVQIGSALMTLLDLGNDDGDADGS